MKVCPVLNLRPPSDKGNAADFVNQGAHRLTREYDPAGERTIGTLSRLFLKNNKRWLFTGVLTKPDRIPATEEDNWLPYIRGKREDPTMWFCVKCPDSEAIKSGITWEDARRDESLWFSRKDPWATLEEGFRKRLGTENLTRCLSDKLCDLIAERFVYPPKCPRRDDPCSNTRAAYPRSNES